MVCVVALGQYYLLLFTSASPSPELHCLNGKGLRATFSKNQAKFHFSGSG